MAYQERIVYGEDGYTCVIGCMFECVCMKDTGMQLRERASVCMHACVCACD